MKIFSLANGIYKLCTTYCQSLIEKKIRTSGIIQLIIKFLGQIEWLGNDVNS